ncbi:DUF1896 domain-containing protein [Agriterribacter sp.]|uniref:DUF1896 domain-containing protein n=1 Tax=Agriterribacter sp. TaxID=2821509 RepID=UPI002B5BB6A8|nr:DUF1896 domain-containing protein [Agriterribacter sp.]HRN57205.1 DUF1896 domain-containing protein [Agriterribacter sp.]HRO46760.1 DUF1896 domain-containing protein [Agriterribacter sp.]
MEQQNELSYFSLRLQELLNTSFPELAHDNVFIQQRSQYAAETYESAFKTGNSIGQCQAIADSVLFDGLYFSKFDTVMQVVSNEFDTIMMDEELRPFAMKMLPVCESVFAKYELTGDFAYSTDFDLLYTELTGTIATWIEEHGL